MVFPDFPVGAPGPNTTLFTLLRKSEALPVAYDMSWVAASSGNVFNFIIWKYVVLFILGQDAIKIQFGTFYLLLYCRAQGSPDDHTM